MYLLFLAVMACDDGPTGPTSTSDTTEDTQSADDTGDSQDTDYDTALPDVSGPDDDYGDD